MSKTILQSIAAALNFNLRINENFDSVSPAAMYGNNPALTTGLTLAYLGGNFAGNAVANGTVSLTASSTNYIVALRSSGAVSVATATTNWIDPAYLPLYLVVTGASTITSIDDKRQAYGVAAAGGGGGGLTNPMTTAGDLIVGGTPASGSAPPTRLAATSNGYVLTLASGIPTWAASATGFVNPMTTAGDLIVGGVAGAAGRIGIGTNGYVLTLASGLPTWAAVAGGGGVLTNWSEGVNSSGVNVAVPVVSFIATNASTDLTAALVPKGVGAFSLAIPDGTAAGGNARGTNAVDLQISRSAANLVAAGNYSALLGGQNNRASANFSNAIGGRGNLASSQYAQCLGGQQNIASTESSTVIGEGGKTKGTNYAFVQAGGYFSAVGDAQTQRMVFHQTTTNATPTPLTTNDFSANGINSIILEDLSACTFSALIVGRTNAGVAASFKVEGLVVRGSGAGTVAIIGTPTVTALGASSGASAWTAGASANTTFGSLQILVTGAASTGIHWVAKVETVEVTG